MKREKFEMTNIAFKGGYFRVPAVAVPELLKRRLATRRNDELVATDFKKLWDYLKKAPYLFLVISDELDR